MNKFIVILIVSLQSITNAIAVNECGIIPIKTWSGQTSRRTEELDTPVKLVVIQHTVSTPCHTDKFCEDILQNIRDYQIKQLHFTDIGPSFLISGHGKVYEGAGWNRVGAHTRGFNDKAIAISFIGDFTYLLPSPEALYAAQQLLDCGVKNNFLTEDYRLCAFDDGRTRYFAMHFALLSYCSVILSLQWCFAGSSCPTIVSRKDWDGLRPVRVKYLPRPVDLVIIQHTATSTCETDSGCAELVRNIQSYHMESLNYWDIGHSFLVGGNGKIYEGPGWLHVGAHTYNYNSKSIGIAFIGNFNNDEPKTKALDAVKALIQCGVQQGHLTSNYHVVAHRQLIAIESPGRKLYNEIRRWPDWLDDVSSIKN
ncbi:unnamed protein product, partial [Iphiclides podalirius]